MAIGMTPAELYHLYRFDEPTRITQDDIRTGLFVGVPTPYSITILEQTRGTQHTPPNRAERRKKRKR